MLLFVMQKYPPLHEQLADALYHFRFFQHDLHTPVYATIRNAYYKKQIPLLPMVFTFSQFVFNQTFKFSILSFVRPVYLIIFSIGSPSSIIFRAIPILAFRSALYNACASSCLAFARSLSFSRNSDEAVIV